MLSRFHYAIFIDLGSQIIKIIKRLSLFTGDGRLSLCAFCRLCSWLLACRELDRYLERRIFEGKYQAGLLPRTNAGACKIMRRNLDLTQRKAQQHFREDKALFLLRDDLIGCVPMHGDTGMLLLKGIRLKLENGPVGIERFQLQIIGKTNGVRRYISRRRQCIGKKLYDVNTMGVRMLFSRPNKAVPYLFSNKMQGSKRKDQIIFFCESKICHILYPGVNLHTLGEGEALELGNGVFG